MVDTVEADFVAITAEIVSAFVSNNSVPSNSLADLISSVHQSVKGLAVKEAEPEAELMPAVSVKKSITDEYLICLEDGRRFKSLRRHLQSAFGMTPGQYRAKWSLPGDYPMVAPAYAAQRSALAKSLGLGNTRKKVSETASAAEPETISEAPPAAEPSMPEPPKKRGRPRTPVA